MARKKVDIILEQTDEKEIKFSREQFIASKRFGKKKDLLIALLNEHKLYTSFEVVELIKDYERMEVK